MDETSLQRFIKFAGSEPEESHDPQLPARLNTAEAAAFLALRENRYGARVRVEQERVPYSALHQAISELDRACR
jgi:hypothetical protein